MWCGKTKWRNITANTFFSFIYFLVLLLLLYFILSLTHWLILLIRLKNRIFRRIEFIHLYHLQLLQWWLCAVIWCSVVWCDVILFCWVGLRLVNLKLNMNHRNQTQKREWKLFCNPSLWSFYLFNAFEYFPVDWFFIFSFFHVEWTSQFVRKEDFL